MNKFENLKINGTLTDYRYMGTIEEAQTIGIFYEYKDPKTSIMTNILEAENYMPPIEYCKEIKCSKFANCPLKTEDIDKRVECTEFSMLEKDIIQTVVYYNEKKNSAVVFEVLGNSLTEDMGFSTIEDLLDNIYSGVNSPFAILVEDKEHINALFDLLNEKDNIVFFSYINTDFTDDFVDYHYRSFKGKKIKGIIDILKEL